METKEIKSLQLPEDFRFEPPRMAEFAYNSVAAVNGTSVPGGGDDDEETTDPDL